MTQGFALRRKILPPLKFYDTNQRFGRKNSLRHFMTQIKGFYDTNQRFGRKNSLRIFMTQNPPAGGGN